MTVDPREPPVPRASHERQLETVVRSQGHAYAAYRDLQRLHAVSLIPSSSVTYVGRGHECAVRIRHDEKVSRRHARLIFADGRWSIADGPSRNGTFVGDKRLTGEEILSDGSVFTVGTTVVVFHSASGADACERLR